MNIVDEIFSGAVKERSALLADGAILTFGELESQVSEAADWLAACEGFHAGIRVGLSCANGVEYIVLALALLKAGACLVPLADELTAAERDEVVERTCLGGILERSDAGRIWRSLNPARFSHEEEFLALNPAFIRFSSGTTGKSKGVVLSHQKLLERITAANAGLQIGPADRVLWMLPMTHHFAVSIVLYLHAGACTVLGESHLAADVLELAEASNATVIYGSPFHHALLAADRGGYAWPELRLAVSTAAALAPGTADEFLRRFGKPLVQGLGIIEIGLPLLNLDGEAPASVGRPQPAYQVRIEGESIGELWVRGPGMFDAYLSPWKLCADVCDDGWFATGDLAEMDETGRVFLRGRKKSVLNVGGMKVFPEEIEAVLNRHPAVARSRVTGLDHPVMGAVPVAEVVLDGEKTATSRQLAEFCRGLLSSYKVPIKFRIVDAVPLTASGKIKRV
ncbi:long-chain fatty acid--CoA ligase [Luteolibacter pohnpeiensis]|uniref:Long-chain fatty acid--CoA ligase n=1 Tax=Luteolibacter pohnpeiensis TaxID=454153 RepID=A0A934VV96_9BACT|nr:fatty acid--CoA ligase family protein [Luteolibacter pohnpeiensis]MBK1883342.1 long-chain fatty acid--CoA ligase [Luteolibacter pohnpeiensis]